MTRFRLLFLLLLSALSVTLWRQRQALRDADEDTAVLWRHLIAKQAECNALDSTVRILSDALEMPAPESAADALLRRLREEQEEELNQHGPNLWTDPLDRLGVTHTHEDFLRESGMREADK